MSHIIRSLTAAIVATSAFIAVTPPATAAGTPGCVTKSEFRAARKGLWKFEVRELFGTGGKQVSLYTSPTFRYESREYRVCNAPSYATVTITFEDHELRSKYAFWR
jgi:hypothetical protein